MVKFIITNFNSKLILLTIPITSRMTELHLTLMNRRFLSSEEAEEEIQNIKHRIRTGESAEDVLWEYRLDASFVIDLALE